MSDSWRKKKKKEEKKKKNTYPLQQSMLGVQSPDYMFKNVQKNVVHLKVLSKPSAVFVINIYIYIDICVSFFTTGELQALG